MLIGPNAIMPNKPWVFIKLFFFLDKCGATSKVHLIIRHKNPLNGSISVSDKLKILR